MGYSLFSKQILNHITASSIVPAVIQTAPAADLLFNFSWNTIVRIAVATSESVLRMPHFARIAVIPAKNEEPIA